MLPTNYSVVLTLTYDAMYYRKIVYVGMVSMQVWHSALPHAIISLPTTPLCNIPVIDSLHYYTKSGFFYAPVGTQCAMLYTCK